MIWLAWAAVAAVVGAAGVATAVKFWPKVTEILRDWLRAHNLSSSVLTSAVIVLDRLAVGVRRRVRVTTRAGHRVETISDQELSIDEIDDPEIRQLLRTERYVTRDVMHLLD